KLFEVGGVVVRYNGVWISPLLDVLRQDDCPRPDRFIGDKQTLAADQAEDVGRLSSRRCAEIEYLQRLAQIDGLRQRLFEKHGARFLDVVCASVKEGIEGEGRA